MFLYTTILGKLLVRTCLSNKRMVEVVMGEESRRGFGEDGVCRCLGLLQASRLVWIFMRRESDQASVISFLTTESGIPNGGAQFR